jgi:hypothetical protein
MCRRRRADCPPYSASSTNFHLSAVLTSRPQLDVGFLDNHRVFHMHNIEDKVVDDDMRLYLKYRLSCEQINSRLEPRTQRSAKEEDIECLVRVSGRLFIIASIAVFFHSRQGCLQLRLSDEETASRFIQGSDDLTPFDALNEFYTIIIWNAVPANCDRDIPKRYQATIVVVQDPLLIGPRANLIDLSPEDVRAVLDNWQSVILLGDNDIPRAYHKSFLDYIRDTTRCKDNDLRIVTRDQHTRFAVRFFDLTNARLKRNILGPGTPATTWTRLKAGGIPDHHVREMILPDLRYACVF